MTDTSLQYRISEAGEEAGQVSLALQLPVIARVKVRVQNRYIKHWVVKNCTVRLIGSSMSQERTTNRFGWATFKDVKDQSEYTLQVLPQQSSLAAVGPAIGEGQAQSARPRRIWRTLEERITFQNGRLVAVTSNAPEHGKVEWARGRRGRRYLKVALQPVWVKARTARRRSADPDLIVIHHTAGNNTGSGLRELTTKTSKSSHYLIDRAGRVTKMVHEDHSAGHAGRGRNTYWGGHQVNRRSIGIDVVHGTGSGYPEVMYQAVIRLIKDIHRAYPGLAPNQVVGHMDVLLAGGSRLGGKPGCPSREWDWGKLSQAGVGFQQRSAAPDLAQSYGGFFAKYPDELLRSGDRDDRRRYGGRGRADIAVDVIGELQEDLGRIGYFCPRTKRYDLATAMAVWMFQIHFFSGPGQRPELDKQVDRRTAERLKMVIP